MGKHGKRDKGLRAHAFEARDLREQNSVSRGNSLPHAEQWRGDGESALHHFGFGGGVRCRESRKVISFLDSYKFIGKTDYFQPRKNG